MSDDTRKPESGSNASDVAPKPAAGQSTPFNPLAGRTFASKSEQRRIEAQTRVTGSTSADPDSSSTTDTAMPPGRPRMPLDADARRALALAPFPVVKSFNAVVVGSLRLTYSGHTEGSTGMIWSGEQKARASQPFVYFVLDGKRYAIAVPGRGTDNYSEGLPARLVERALMDSESGQAWQNNDALFASGHDDE